MSEDIVEPTKSEQAPYNLLAADLQGISSASLRVGKKEYRLPPTAIQALRVAAVYLSRDLAVKLVPYSSSLTIQQTADLLGVSRPYVVDLIARGKLPLDSEASEERRRIRLADALTYRDGIRDTMLSGHLSTEFESPVPPAEFTSPLSSKNHRLELLSTAMRDAHSYLKSLVLDPNEGTTTHNRAHDLVQRAEAAESTGAKVDVLLDVDAFLSLRRLPSRGKRPISRRAREDRELALSRVLTQAIEVWIDPAREIELLSEAVQQGARKYLSDAAD